MTPSRHGQARSHRLLWVLSLCLGLVSPAGVGADLYTWVDDRGIQNIVDNPTLVPERFRRQARRFMTPSVSYGQAPSTGLPRAESRGSGPSGSAEPLGLSSGRRLTVEAPVEPPASETQGSVAVALAERLALAHRPTPLQAASALLERRILPPAGWMLDEPITPEWMADLAHSLLDASSAGRVLQTPEAALQTLEAVAAERGIAVVAFEAPPPPQPQVIVAQPETLIVERVFVPAFPLHTRHLVHHPHFGKRFFKEHPQLEHRFRKNNGDGQRHPMDLRGRKTAGFAHVGSHSIQSGSTGLTTGGREKRSGTTRCSSRSIGHTVQICP